MSLISTLNIGKSALLAQQAALQVTSNNISNAGNADYTRETASVESNGDQQISPGVFMGTGVNLSSVSRQIDEALDARLRSAITDTQSANVQQDWMSRVESAFNALSGSDLSSQMSSFFNAWSDLANNPQDAGKRQVVVQSGQSLAQSFQSLRSQLTGLVSDADTQLQNLTSNVSGLAQQIATLNGKITSAESGGKGQANDLRDQRDALVKQLSQLGEIQTSDQGSSMNITMAGQNLVTGTSTHTIDVTKITSGQIGALESVETQINGVVGQLDSVANTLVFQLNVIHSSGQGTAGYNSLTSDNAVADPTVPLVNSGLENIPSSDSFVLHIKSKASGNEIGSALISTDSTTSMNDLASQIDALPNVSAQVVNGKLQITGDTSDIQVSFSGDSNGLLAALGVNTFFTGNTAGNIQVNTNIVNNQSLLAAATNGQPGDNTNALAIAKLESQPVANLNGSSLTNSYQSIVNTIAGSVSSAKSNATASQAVQDTLQSQHDSLSGVSMDEESINLIQQQRAYQGAARLITTIEDMMKTLLAM